jgi:hypothetical protein
MVQALSPLLYWFTPEAPVYIWTFEPRVGAIVSGGKVLNDMAILAKTRTSDTHAQSMRVMVAEECTPNGYNHSTMKRESTLLPLLLTRKSHAASARAALARPKYLDSR